MKLQLLLAIALALVSSPTEAQLGLSVVAGDERGATKLTSSRSDASAANFTIGSDDIDNSGDTTGHTGINTTQSDTPSPASMSSADRYTTDTSSGSDSSSSDASRVVLATGVTLVAISLAAML